MMKKRSGKMNPLIRKCLMLMPDRLFIDMKYFNRFHKFPNLNNPKTFNEKIQWLKLHDKNPIYNIMVDIFV